MKRLNIGIDVSKDKLDICILDDKPDFITVLNNKDSIKGFLEYLQSAHKNTLFCFGYESTSTYTLELKEIISSFDYLQIELNPYKISLYLKHLDTRSKTDKIDSYGIAKYISNLNIDDFKTDFNIDEVKYKKIIATLKHLEKVHTQLVNFRKSQKNVALPFIDEQLQKIEKEIKKLRDVIKKQACKMMYETLPALKQIKQDIKGVGDGLLLSLMMYFLDYGKYTKKQITCHIGLSPRVFQSGSSVNKRNVLSKQGNAYVRKILYMSTVSAIKSNEIIKEKYQNLIKKGKSAKVALVACMSHLLRAVFIKYETSINLAK